MYVLKWLGYLTEYSDSLCAGKSGVRILVGAKYSAPVKKSSEALPASYTMGSDSFLGLKPLGCC